ncbi:MAG: hypothetical protein Q9159_005319 [Coniocarpon cinnabarinum]
MDPGDPSDFGGSESNERDAYEVQRKANARHRRQAKGNPSTDEAWGHDRADGRAPQDGQRHRRPVRDKPSRRSGEGRSTGENRAVDPYGLPARPPPPRGPSLRNAPIPKSQPSASLPWPRNSQIRFKESRAQGPTPTQVADCVEDIFVHRPPRGPKYPARPVNNDPRPPHHRDLPTKQSFRHYSEASAAPTAIQKGLPATQQPLYPLLSPVAQGIHASNDLDFLEDASDEAESYYSPPGPNSPFKPYTDRSSRLEKAHVATSISSQDAVDFEFARRAARFINQPPGRILTPREVEAVLNVVLGTEEGQLYTQEEWFRDRAQDLALTVLTAKNTTWTDFQELQVARGRASMMLETEKLEVFLNGVNELVHKGSREELREWLVVDPPFNDDYNAIIARLRNLPQTIDLQFVVRDAMSAASAQGWSSFMPFMHQYLVFLRDLDMTDLLQAYNMLKELLSKGNTALQHSGCGDLILPTVIKYSQMLSGFAIKLDRQSGLAAELPRSVSDESSESLPERTANIIRQAFVTCLNDRTDPDNTAEYSRRHGIYILANCCLKILFACKKSGSAEQIFTNVYNQAPPLSLYPKAEQVTYLYYLGRFLWTTGHWHRAILALQAAYDMSPKTDGTIKQRRHILIYLIASNMILGRFPSQELYSRPEAVGFAERFHPICQSIAKGDLESFYRLTAMDAPHARWFLGFRILLQLRNRCEVLVWRSLARRTFLLKGQTPENDKGAYTLALQDFQTVYSLLEMRARLPAGLTSQIPNGVSCKEWMQLGPFRPHMALNVHPSFQDDDDVERMVQLPSMLHIESIFSSLIGQGLLRGYLSHKSLRYAIQGAKLRGPLLAGFPNVWQTVTEGEEDEEVPGWKKENSNAGSSAGGGRVIHLTDARPVGVAPAG